MNIIETDYWCLMLPAEWSAEKSEDVVLITDHDGVGELAVTTLVRDPGASEDVGAINVAREESPEVVAWSSAEFGCFSGFTGRFEEGNSVIQEWYLAFGDALIYVTYTCGTENDGLDAAAVDDILATLVAGDALTA